MRPRDRLGVAIPVGRAAALVAVAASALVIAQGARGPRWRMLQPGIEFTTLHGEPYCRRGSSIIAVLRIDPGRTRLRVHHYTQIQSPDPPGIVAWQERLRAVAVFNAGQYYPDYSYMGLLVGGGRVVSRRLHPGFQAALVASPERGAPTARVLDLSRERLDPERPRWREVAQSFMLFDRARRIRVRNSEQVANRTVVGEDRHGRIVVLTSEGGYTLWDFARLLQAAPLQLSHAMAMDGGYEAEMCVAAAGFRYASFGRWKRGERPSVPGAQVPLPAVISVVAR